MKVKYHLSIGLSGADQEEVVDLPDDWTDEDIEEDFKTWAQNYIDMSWWKVEDE